MKGICFLVIAFALIMSYQSNPIGTILIGGAAIVVYAIFKYRKNNNIPRRRGGIFRKGVASAQSPMEDLISLLVVQNLLDKEPRQVEISSKKGSGQKEDEIEQMKQEVLALFEED